MRHQLTLHCGQQLDVPRVPRRRGRSQEIDALLPIAVDAKPAPSITNADAVNLTKAMASRQILLSRDLDLRFLSLPARRYSVWALAAC